MLNVHSNTGSFTVKNVKCTFKYRQFCTDCFNELLLCKTCCVTIVFTVHDESIEKTCSYQYYNYSCHAELFACVSVEFVF